MIEQFEAMWQSRIAAKEEQERQKQEKVNFDNMLMQQGRKNNVKSVL